jgi:hypothetical protein
MLILTFAGDESGNLSFSFGRGATPYFVVAVIATYAPDALRDLLVNLRQSCGLPAHYEFSFHALSSARLRRRTFEALAQADFEAWAITVDKAALPDTFRVMRPLDLYLYFVTEVIRLIPPAEREGATLILDEYGSPSEVRRGLRRFMVVRNIPRLFRRVLVKRSESEPLIQFADLVSGAIYRRVTKADAGAYDCIAGKLRHILEFEG